MYLLFAVLALVLVLPVSTGDACKDVYLRTSTCIFQKSFSPPFCTSSWGLVNCKKTCNHCEEKPSCAVGCQNGGTCTAPDVCSCSNGYGGNSCQTPICAAGCQNGGTCTAPDVCSCSDGYGGTSCQTPICAVGCQNGGTCTAPDVCSCPDGYGGNSCQTRDACKDVKIASYCISMKNVSPPYCESSEALEECKKTCNRCGEEPSCAGGCQNGGNCTATDVCSCHAGYEGNSCQTRSIRVLAEIGCYKANFPGNHSRVFKHYTYLRDQIQWDNLGATVQACRNDIAQRTTDDKVFFGIEFWGECWYGNNDPDLVFHLATSTNCFEGVGSDHTIQLYILEREE